MAVETARIEELRRRVDTDPASISFAALAEEYRRAGRHDDALATCLVGLARHPAYVSARVTLGRTLMELGKYDDARVEFERVLRMAPENLAAIRALATLHERIRRSGAVRRFGSRAVRRPALRGGACGWSWGRVGERAGCCQTTGTLCRSSAVPALESFLAAIEQRRQAT